MIYMKTGTKNFNRYVVRGEKDRERQRENRERQSVREKQRERKIDIERKREREREGLRETEKLIHNLCVFIISQSDF